MNHVHSRMAIQHHPYWSLGGIPPRPAQNEFNNFRCKGKFERSLTLNQIQTYSKKATLKTRFSVAHTHHHRPTLIPLPSLSGNLHMMALGATGKLTKNYFNYHTTPIWMPHLIRCSISVFGWSSAINSASISSTVPFLLHESLMHQGLNSTTGGQHWNAKVPSTQKLKHLLEDEFWKTTWP